MLDITVLKSMLRSDVTGRPPVPFVKNNFNCTNVVDGVESGSKITNLFKGKYERLFNSVKCSEYEHNLLATNIDLEVESYCSNDEIC